MTLGEAQKQVEKEEAERRLRAKMEPWGCLILALIVLGLLAKELTPAPWHVEIDIDGQVLICERRLLGLEWEYHRAEYEDGMWYWWFDGKRADVPGRVLRWIQPAGDGAWEP